MVRSDDALLRLERGCLKSSTSQVVSLVLFQPEMGVSQPRLLSEVEQGYIALCFILHLRRSLGIDLDLPIWGLMFCASEALANLHSPDVTLAQK